TGRTHDWAVSRDVVATATKPVYLAGGLNPGNVAEAIAAVRPFGVDVCTGLRREGGLDAGLLGAFMAAVRLAS
ncbi:MAG: phosphoribosylanthranilate isomerase, partial [Hyphomicrobiales bacterium]|nr:phosphoribosylanthranilate isomerase [Hyphomicrobiales bacterium]